MKFDKTKVYTAVNAEDLPIGSVCIYADTLRELRKRVQTDSSEHKQVLTGLYDDSYIARFMTAEYFYSLAYFVENQSTRRYKPFENIEEAMMAIKKHGWWVKHKKGHFNLLITGFDIYGFFLGNTKYYSFRTLFSGFVFGDDSSPCGELV